MSAVTFNLDAEGIALITLPAAERSVQPFTAQLRGELQQAIERIASDPGIKGVIVALPAIRADEPPAELMALSVSGVSAVEARDFSRAWQRILRRMETSGKPFAAVMTGQVSGAVFEVALACHHRVLANDGAVSFPEVQLGLLPAGGGTQRLPRLIGVAQALPLLFNGNAVSAADAARLGIVHALAPSEGVVAAAREWLMNRAEAVQPWDKKGFCVPGGAGPLASFANETFMVGAAQLRKQIHETQPAPLAILSCVYEGTIAGFEAALAIEASYFGRLLSDPVARNLMRAAANRIRAQRLARRPTSVPRAPVRKIGVLGAGMMGAGIAHVAASAGLHVALIDVTQEAADKGKAYSEGLLARAVNAGAMSAAQASAILARIEPTPSYGRLEGCDVVIEAVFEDRPLKTRVIREAEAALSDAAVVASNTSTLPISGLAAATRRPGNFIGLHFFSPVDKMPLLEIIRGRETSDATLARALDFAALLTKTPIVVNDAPGFFTTRVFSAFIDEGACMLAEGIEPALIENAAKQAGMPVGPLAQFDEVSQELSWKIILQARADGLAERYRRSAAAPVIEMMIALSRRGRRHGGGFYEYPRDGGRKFLWPALREQFPVSRVQPSVAEAKARLLTIQALEAARCMEEGVIEHAEDADLGSILGIGFPRWTGGVASYIDTIGLQRFVAQCREFASKYGARYEPSAWLLERTASGQSFYPRAQAS